MNAICAQAARGNGTATGSLRQSRSYRTKPKKSIAFRKILPGRPDRRPPLPPANGVDQARREWLGRAGDVLAAFVVNLDSQHLSKSERRDGWQVFERLLSAYVDRKHALSRGAA